jgi:hypothetical protein
VFALLLASATAWADDPIPVRPVRFVAQPPFLTMSAVMPEFADATLRQRLQSGFAQTVVLRAFLYRDDRSRPLGVTVRSYRIVYDLWDEQFLVQIDDPQGRLNLRLKTVNEAVLRLSHLDAFPLAALPTIESGSRYFVAVIAELNPISPELVTQVRRWLARPAERLSGNETFFGSFVSVFANNRLDEAERIVRFRSPSFARAELQK